MLALPIFKTKDYGLPLFALAWLLPILVCSCLPELASPYNLTVETDRSVYQPRSQARVSGRLTYNNWPQQNRLVTICVYNPDSSLFDLTTETTDTDGRYSYSFGLPPQVQLGVFTVSVSSNVEIGTITNSTTFKVELEAYNLTINATSGGATNPPPGTYTCPANSQIQVTANASTSFRFDHWELDEVNVGSANPYTVTFDQNHTLKAVFLRVYDIAVLNVVTSKDGCVPLPSVCQGFHANINVTVANLKTTDTTFNVSVYANAFMIGQKK